MDSAVLLHMLHSYLKTLSGAPHLCAVHVDHGIHPKALSWRKHCAQYCAKLGVQLIVEQVAVHAMPRQSLEATARKMRYTAFRKHLSEDDCLLLAHHTDDQMENFLLRLNRGSGTRGLSAMVEDRALGGARLLRPLLRWTRTELRAYAATHQLDWVEDESNEDLSLDRNFLRHKVLPLLEDRWQGYRRTWQRAIALIQESELLNEELARLDWDACDENPLHRSYLKKIGATRCANLLRCHMRTLNIEPPNEARLREFIRQIYEATEGARPQLCWRSASMRVRANLVEIKARN